MIDRLHSFFVAAAVVLTAVAACSAGRTSDSGLASTYAPASDSGSIKDLFDVGGRSLFLECTGTGAPTIIMDAGLGNSHTTWAKVAPQLHTSNRTCSYDRANIGASDRAPTPRTSADVVADLHRLLEAADVPPPYLLVGHSFGGISMRLYASTYPLDVAGIVLVDPTPTTFVDDECIVVDAGLCETLRADWEPSKNPEGLDLVGSAHALDSARPIPAVPLVVLAATNHRQDAITDPAIEQQIEELWQRRLQELAASVPSGRVEVVSSGHDIQSLHPQAVIEAIRSVLSDQPTAS